MAGQPNWPGAGDPMVQSINPATGEVLAEFAVSTAAEVCSAVETARAAQRAWAETPAPQRERFLRELREELFTARGELAATITGENGKPIVESLITELLVTLDAARHLAEHGAKVLEGEAVPHWNPAAWFKCGRVTYEPLGVVGIISPWNYPVAIPAGQILPALFAGNAVVLKPSEYTTISALEFADLCARSGLPPGLLQVLPGDHTTGAALAAGRLDKLVFTGSAETGRHVAAAAAQNLVPVVLELGGKDAMIVLEDANPERAASGALWGGMMNCGQTCISVERVYVARALMPAFIEALVARCRKLRLGNGMDPDVEIGPLIRERQVVAIEHQLAEAREQGARVLTGGRRSALGPLFFEPTVLDRVNHEMMIMRRETFGPVLAVMGFDEVDEAVALANDSEYGLAASVWTADTARGRAVAARIEAGTVMVNDAISAFGICEAPHGGVKASGYGRTHGKWGLQEMSRMKYIEADSLPRIAKPWWFAYDEQHQRAMDGFLGALHGSAWGERVRGGWRAARHFFRKRL